MSLEPRPRAVLVVNPHKREMLPSSLWARASNALGRGAELCAVIETCADERNVERISRAIRDTTPATVIAAGGDGTVNDVVRAIGAAGAPVPPALAIIPLGTGNNAARALGLRSCRSGGHAAVDEAVATALDGVQRRIDLGEVNGHPFIGAFAVGMDADVLATYNAYRARRGWAANGGYALYLWSCAVNLFRRHGGAGHLILDGSLRSGQVYNLVVTNTALYAGEFRFDAGDHANDGWLDVHTFVGPGAYLSGFFAAWIRHLRYNRGQIVHPSAGLRRVRELVIELRHPVAGQIDGEEHDPAVRFLVRVLPRALSVRVNCAPEG